MNFGQPILGKARRGEAKPSKKVDLGGPEFKSHQRRKIYHSDLMFPVFKV
jgi:hypothetical protein